PPAPAPAVPIGLPAIPTGPPAPAPPKPAGLPGMPPVPDRHNIYADAGANMLSPAVARDPALVYVPHNYTGDVWVIDQHTFAVVGKYHLGGQLQHVAPSWNMRTLYAGDDTGNHLTPFDPATGTPGTTFSVIDPYNMYFTPDGRYAISVAEGHNELVWYDPHTWQQHDTTPTPACAGINHGDFSADGLTAVFTCEFAGRVAVIDVATHKLVRTVDMPRRDTHMGPQDIKLAPDASAYYVADCDGNGVWVLDAAATRVERFVPTGLCAHGLYLSRDSKLLFVTDRGEGSVSVLDAYTGAPVTTWHIPGGGSPDMGNLTADGTQLWLSGRYNNVVYVFSTADGHLIKKIPVGGGPHGLAVWPQPGRYSLGHTGITR
ncbi:MAG: beta-propeller fold lactonase family protein, partial [Mycolicibacterium sp.]|nr:beta-propeller fold lactonase family protein [Mycolicibacterium sp.]